ncbi:MAG: DUF2007 domain-containing protein [Chitinophagaceae bacterium]|nr:DUF2007 domain-containing protein [Chitinophagaceae bacterium]
MSLEQHGSVYGWLFHNLPDHIITISNQDHNTEIKKRFVPLKSFNNYIEANIVLKMLQDAGINCHLQDEHVNTIVNLSAGMRLMVFYSQEERARNILIEVENDFLRSVPCTNCGSKSLEVIMVDVDMEPHLGSILSLLSRWFSDEGTMVRMKHYACADCGTVFEDIPLKKE